MSGLDFGRRAEDREVDPVIENYVERRLGDTRHGMRGEIQAGQLELGNKISELVTVVTQGNLRQVEHQAMLSAKLVILERVEGDLRAVVLRVSALETNQRSHDAVAKAVDRNRAVLRNVAFGLAGLMVTCVGIILSQIH